jgi:hypothetical protein
MLTSRLKVHGRAFAHIAAFHPEITAPILRGYVRARASALREEGVCSDTLHDAILDAADGGRVLENFIALAFAR